MSYRQRGAPPDADLVLIQSCAIPYKAPANSPAFLASTPHLKYGKTEGIAEESDRIDKKVRDDQRPHLALEENDDGRNREDGVKDHAIDGIRQRQIQKETHAKNIRPERAKSNC